MTFSTQALGSASQKSEAPDRLFPAILATAAVGFVFDRIAAPLPATAVLALIIGVIVRYSAGVSSIRYMKRKLQDWSSLRHSIVVLLSMIGLSGLLFTASIGVAKVQGTILNRRLSEAIRAPREETTPARPSAFGESQAERGDLAAILDDARISRVVLSPAMVHPLLDAQRAGISTPWRTYVAATNYYLSSLTFNDGPPKFEEMTFTFLPTMRLVRDKFSNVRIRYAGGALYMENVVFDDCVFDVNESENGKEFLNAISKAAGRPVSINLQ